MKRSPPPPPLRCIVSTVAQARNVVVVVMTEANSLARSSGILSSAAERRSITEETRCGILQLPSPFPLYTVCRPQGASSLLLPQRQKAERRTRFLPYPTSRLDAVVVFFNFAFSAAPLLSLSHSHSLFRSITHIPPRLLPLRDAASRSRQSKPQTSIQKKQKRDSISQSTYSALQQQSNLSRRSNIASVIFVQSPPNFQFTHDPGFSSSN